MVFKAVFNRISAISRQRQTAFENIVGKEEIARERAQEIMVKNHEQTF